MKKLTRLVLILLGLFTLLAVAAPLGGAWWLRSYVNKERLVLETEKNINARVQLDDVVFTLFAWPPTLRLSGLKIAPRDQYAGTPLEARPPLKHAPVEIEMAYLELEPDGLWRREVYPRVLRIMGVADPMALGYDAYAMVGLKVASGHDPQKAAHYFRDRDEVTYVIFVAGRYDLLIEVICETHDQLALFLREHCYSRDDLASVELMVGLAMYKNMLKWGQP